MEWSTKWRRHSWRIVLSEVGHRDRWEQILWPRQQAGDQVQIKWVPLHPGVRGNGGADEMAWLGRLKHPNNLLLLSKRRRVTEAAGAVAEHEDRLATSDVGWRGEGSDSVSSEPRLREGEGSDSGSLPQPQSTQTVPPCAAAQLRTVMTLSGPSTSGTPTAGDCPASRRFTANRRQSTTNRPPKPQVETFLHSKKHAVAPSRPPWRGVRDLPIGSRPRRCAG